MKRLVGVYASPEPILEDPEFLAALKDKGVNLIIMLGGALRLSEEVLAENPMPPEVRDRMGPGLSLTQDDSPLRKAIDLAHREGFSVWLSAFAWWGGAEHAPELMMRHISGRPISEFAPAPFSNESKTLVYCPNDERTNRWFALAYTDAVLRYDVEGIDLTHARYSHPAFVDNLFGCACERCARAARSWGYDWEKMKKGVQRTLDEIRSLDAGRVREFSELRLGFTDFLHLLGGPEVVDWFHFRADSIRNALKGIRDYFKDKAPDKVFGSDAHVPSFALLVGHRYKDFREFSDFMSPLLPWFEIHYLANFAALADRLCRWVKGLEEDVALQFVYRLFGYDRFDMPSSVKSLKVGEPGCEEEFEGDLYAIVEWELRKARAYSPKELPSYPVLKGGRWPADVIRRLIRATEEMGHDGVVFQPMYISGGETGYMRRLGF